MGLVDKIKAYLLSPSEAFENEKSTTMVDALKYLLILTIVIAVLLAVLSYASLEVLGTLMGGAALGPMAFVTTLVSVYVGVVIGSFIGAILFHIFAYIFGARKGFTQTYKITVYSMTPTLLLGWIPILNFLTGLWSLYLEYVGLKKLHEMTSGRAILTILIPIIIVGIIALFGALSFLMYDTTAFLPTGP